MIHFDFLCMLSKTCVFFFLFFPYGCVFVAKLCLKDYPFSVELPCTIVKSVGHIIVGLTLASLSFPQDLATKYLVSTALS